MTLRYLPHVLYSLAITSLSVHLLVHRNAAAAQRAHLAAQISILQSLAQRLKAADTPLPDGELEMLGRLVRAHDDKAPSAQRVLGGGVGWKDVFFGAKRAEGEGEMSKWDTMDFEKARRELVEKLP